MPMMFVSPALALGGQITAVMLRGCRSRAAVALVRGFRPAAGVPCSLSRIRTIGKPGLATMLRVVDFVAPSGNSAYKPPAAAGPGISPENGQSAADAATRGDANARMWR